jgi:hypothetical protein
MKALSTVVLLQILGVSLGGKVLPKTDAPPPDTVFFKAQHPGYQNVSEGLVLGQCRDIFEANKISSSKCSGKYLRRKRPSARNPPFVLLIHSLLFSYSNLVPQGENSILKLAHRDWFCPSNLKYNAWNNMGLCTRGCGSANLFSGVAQVVGQKGKQWEVRKNKYMSIDGQKLPDPEAWVANSSMWLLLDRIPWSYIDILSGSLSVPSQDKKKPDGRGFNAHHAFIMSYEGQSHLGVEEECLKAFAAAGINYVKDSPDPSDFIFGGYAVKPS